ncbi:MAG: hypothetical protein LRY55_08510 [Leadbetterella sp.]|nr:hypothetical protein [Leadbetterella sp.]
MTLSSLKGNIKGSTSGGSIKLNQLGGDISLSTSGGSITAEILKATSG